MRAIVALALFSGCKDSDEGETDPATEVTPIPAPPPEDADGDGFAVGVDCDDTDASVHPEAEERCNGADDDCDGVADDGLPLLTSFADADGDGFGAGPGAESCGVQAGWVDNDADCDDGAAEVSPAGIETCDGRDEDCDGVADDGLPTEDYWPDADGDGFGAGSAVSLCTPQAGFVDNDEDCDDSSDGVAPGVPEICDAVDQDCDGVADEGLWTDPYWPDLDGDGRGDEAATAVQACSAPPDHVGTAGDCDDADPDVTERIWWFDGDGDGYGTGSPTSSCSPVADHAERDGDCDDVEASIHPDAPLDRCDAVDSDCDGQVEEVEVGSGRAALVDALAAATDGQVLCLPPGIIETGPFEGAALSVTGKRIGVVGAGRGQTVFDGVAGASVWIGPGSDVALTRMSFTGVGGILAQDSHIAVSDVDLHGFGPSCSGCVVNLYNGIRAEFVDVDFFDVDHEGAGVAPIVVTDGTVRMRDVTVRDFTHVAAAGGGGSQTGGAMHFFEVDASLEDVQIAGIVSQAVTLGGALYVNNSVLRGDAVVVGDIDVSGSFADGGAIFATNSDVTLHNAILADIAMETENAARGLGLFSVSSDVRLENTVIYGSEVVGAGSCGGVAFWQSGGTASFTNTVFEENIGPCSGFASTSSGAVAFDYSSFWSNGTGFDGVDDPIGTDGNLSTAAGFVNTTDPDPVNWDFGLSANSGLIDAGDPDLLDGDGSRSDIGAYGGPGSEW